MFPHSAVKAKEIEALQPASKQYKYSVGGALYVLVKPNGSKYWRFKYYYNGKENSLSIGVFPYVSLKEAIAARDKAKQLLKDGVNPNEIKRQEAKSRLKPNIGKAFFRMEVSINGELTIETYNKIVRLTQSQTESLRSFLLVKPDQPQKRSSC